MGKTFKITINARNYEVEVGALSENPVKVLVDGDLYHVQIEETGNTAPGAGSSVPPLTAGAVTYPPAASPDPGKLTKAPLPADTRAVIAPMPGLVLALKVNVGDRVKCGEEVCTLESMKMELNIMAARDGVVSKVCVSVGQSVVHGTVLIELE